MWESLWKGEDMERVAYTTMEKRRLQNGMMIFLLPLCESIMANYFDGKC